MATPSAYPAADHLSFSRGRFPKGCLFAVVTSMALLAATAPRAEEDDDPPPDPLAEAEATTFGQSGYFGGGNVPTSLDTPSRFQIGDFALSSRAAFGAVYDDNVEADDKARDEDVFLTFSPSVRAQSVYARHSLGIGAGATAATALKDSTDDFIDWRIGADGRLDLSRRSRIDAAVGYSREVEDDESIDAEDADDDAPIHNIDANIGYNADGDRLGYGLRASLKRLDIEGEAFDDRDNIAVGIDGSLRYRLTEDLTLSAGPSYRRTTYDDDVAADGDGRDAERVAFRIGAGYRASRTIRARAALGYAQVDFDDADRESEDTATGSAGLTWTPGNGTTLDLQADRNLGVSIVDDEDSRIRTSASATLAHRLALGSRSAISSSMALGVTRSSDLDRTDRTLVAGLTFAYRLAEHAFFTSSYRFSQRDSDESEADYYRNLISLGVTLSY